MSDDELPVISKLDQNLEFRVGRHQPANIYRNDERFAHAVRDEDGPLIAAALNGCAAGEGSGRDWAVEAVRLEEIARQAVVLCADILSRFSCQGDQISTVWMTGTKRDEWGRQVLGWQAELDRDKP